MFPKIYILKYTNCAEATIIKICKIQFQKDICVCYKNTKNTHLFLCVCVCVGG